MNHEITLQEIFQNSNLYLNKKVTIKATLAINSVSSYLVSELARPDDLMRIEIPSTDLEKHLDRVVGGWMGGKFNYLDNVTINGKLSQVGAKEGVLSLSEIVKIQLEREGETYTIDITQP
jgi:hypothetical protein